MDSRGLFDTISTLHVGKEYRLRQTVQMIRDSFEDGDSPDFLTKWCAQIQRKFNEHSTSDLLTINT